MSGSEPEARIAERDELARSLAMFEGLGARLKEVSDLATLLSKSLKKGAKEKERPGEADELKNEIGTLKESLAEMQDAIALRNQTIFDLTIQNSDLMKNISDLKKMSSEKIDKYDMLGKRNLFEESRSKDKNSQTSQQVENKSVQVFRYSKKLGEDCEDGMRRRKCNLLRLHEIIKLLSLGPEAISQSDKSLTTNPQLSGVTNSKNELESHAQDKIAYTEKDRSTRATGTRKA